MILSLLRRDFCQWLEPGIDGCRRIGTPKAEGEAFVFASVFKELAPEPWPISPEASDMPLVEVEVDVGSVGDADDVLLSKIVLIISVPRRADSPKRGRKKFAVRSKRWR